MPVTEARSLASTARRAQIVAATTDVIAEEGFRQATFARIAARAQLSSTRLISYHFAGKDDLVAAVVDDVLAAIGSFVGDRLGAQPGAAAQLRAYIEGVVAFTAANRNRMRALLHIVLAGALPSSAAGPEIAVPAHLEAILARGQIEGEFRAFDVRVVAVTVQRAVESLPFALEADPTLDCDVFGRELVTLFDLATRAESVR